MVNQDLPTNANEILASATPDQIKWVVARLTSKTDREAAKSIGVHPSTVSKWPNKAKLYEAVSILLREPVETALKILQEAAIDAANVLVDELGHKNKLRAADSILDRIGLRGVQKQEISGPGGGPLVIGNVTLNDKQRAEAVQQLLGQFPEIAAGGLPETE